MANSKRKTVTLAGAGSLAHALAEMLPRAGYEIVEIVTRSKSEQARELGRETGATVHTLIQAQWPGDIVWLAVSDRAIPELASALAPLANRWKGKVVLHSSGALSSQVLRPLRQRGAAVASAHPMMTFVSGETPGMAGVVWTVEGDATAVAAARQIVSALGGRVVKIDPKQKALYHAFGAFLSPLLVMHLVTASQLAVKAGIPLRDVNALMKPIVEQTTRNLFAHLGEPGGAGKAFSGPLIRGDVETVRAHLRSLQQVPSARRLYVSLVRAALKSELPVRNRRAIADAIGRSRG